MSKVVIMTGATGGIGSSLLSKLTETRETAGTVEVVHTCVLSRKTIADDHSVRPFHCIHADFSFSNYSFLTELESWLNNKAATTDIEEIILVLAAATITPIKAIGSFAIEQLQENLSININAQVMIINTVVSYALNKKIPLKIVHFDSGAAYRPIGGWSLYCASKAYISMFLKVLKTEHDELRIVLFDPGVVDTEMQSSIREAHSDAFVDQGIFQDLKRNNKLNRPDDVSEFVISHYIMDWNAKEMKEKFS